MHCRPVDLSASSTAVIAHLDRDDVPELHDLLTLFADAFGEPETYNASRPNDSYLQNLLANDSCIVLTARRHDLVIGGLVAYELPKVEQKRSEIYIYDLAVAESARRQGVATALIDALKRIAANRGAWVIFVQADRGDEAAISLYTKLGIREDVLHFDIDIAHGD